MSKPISNIKPLRVDEKTRRQQDLEEIEETLADHKEAILETVHLIQNLHDRGLLELMNGFFSQGGEVFPIIVRELNKPNNSRVLENLAGLIEILSSVDVNQLKVLADRTNNGLKEVASTDPNDSPSNVFQLMKVLKDPEINRSIGMLLSFLKGMGKE